MRKLENYQKQSISISSTRCSKKETMLFGWFMVKLQFKWKYSFCCFFYSLNKKCVWKPDGRQCRMIIFLWEATKCKRYKTKYVCITLYIDELMMAGGSFRCGMVFDIVIECTICVPIETYVLNVWVSLRIERLKFDVRVQYTHTHTYSHSFTYTHAYSNNQKRNNREKYRVLNARVKTYKKSIYKTMALSKCNMHGIHPTLIKKNSRFRILK